MPNIKSAVKRMRQNPVRRAANRQHRSRMRTSIRALRKLIEAGDLEEARAQMPKVYSVIDKVAQKGVIHANTAARYKSRLTRQINRAS